MGEAAGDVLDTFLSMEAVVDGLTGGTVTEAARVRAHQGTGIGGRDAAILVTAKRRGAKLLTNDRPLARAATAMGLQVDNPAA